ncbi:MAG: hypothetical protein O7B98_10300, partial [Alphaproteobacteria bacterium]|nr:hypothetical protein [Alphaproteobacteria bacterium]
NPRVGENPNPSISPMRIHWNGFAAASDVATAAAARNTASMIAGIVVNFRISFRRPTFLWMPAHNAADRILSPVNFPWVAGSMGDTT